MLPKSAAQCLSIAGLLINALGALLLIAFTSPGLDVTKTGESLFTWTNEPPPEQLAANRRKYRRHRAGFKAGVTLLLVGYVLQLVAASLA